MIKQKKFNDQDQIFTSSQEKKELYGEVFTPYILIEMMLNSIPITIKMEPSENSYLWVYKEVIRC